MPNGHRYPFRFPIRSHLSVINVVDSPSPIHSSDSETTFNHKVRYRGVAYRVLRKWKSLVMRERIRRMMRTLMAYRLIDGRVAFVTPVLYHIAQFLVSRPRTFRARNWYIRDRHLRDATSAVLLP